MSRLDMKEEYERDASTCTHSREWTPLNEWQLGRMSTQETFEQEPHGADATREKDAKV